MQNFVWMDEQESEGHGRRWCRGAEASGPSWRHTPAEPSSGHSSMDPFLAHSSLSPSVILIPEGPQKNRWSRGVKRGCESIIKAEQWLPRACSSRSLTVCLVHTHVPSWFKAQAQISASSLPPCLQSQPLHPLLPHRRLS